MLGLIILLISLLAALFVILFWVWSIIHCLINKHLTANQKLFWVFSMLIMPIIASILYIIFLHKKQVIL
ncbi:MAG: PLDc N-terminal domain-containing protein [Candidatus Woesearchaeota archaeon]